VISRNGYGKGGRDKRQTPCDDGRAVTENQTQGANHMPSIKQVVAMAIPTAIIMAVVFRVEAVRKIVIGG